MFVAVELNDEDRSRLADHGIESPERFPHPCRHFAAPACAIYALRPQRCGEYRCRVLGAMIDGTIDPQAAHDLVDRARTMRAQVSDVLPPGLSVVQLANDVRTGAPGAKAPGHMQALARFVAYRLFVERHFLGPKSHWMTRTKA